MAFNTGYGIDLLYTDEIIEWNNLYAKQFGQLPQLGLAGYGRYQCRPLLCVHRASGAIRAPHRPNPMMTSGWAVTIGSGKTHPAFTPAIRPSRSIRHTRWTMTAPTASFTAVSISVRSRRVNLCPGDFNNDGIVNIMDRNGFLSHWLLDSSMAGYDSAYDLTADDTVNLEDWAVFSKTLELAGPVAGNDKSVIRHCRARCNALVRASSSSSATIRFPWLLG